MCHAKETNHTRPHRKPMPNMAFLLLPACVRYTLRGKNIHHVLLGRYFGKGLCTRAPEGAALLSVQSLMLQWGPVTASEETKTKKLGMCASSHLQQWNPHTLCADHKVGMIWCLSKHKKTSLKLLASFLKILLWSVTTFHFSLTLCIFPLL